MDILLNEQTLLEKLTMASGIIGRDERDAAGGSRYDEVHITVRDHPFLKKEIAAAEAILLRTLYDFATQIDGHTIKVQLDKRNTAASANALPLACEEYVLNHATAKWLSLKAVDKAGQFATAAADNLAMIKRIIYFKGKPIV